MKKRFIAVLLCLTMAMASTLTAFAMEGGADIKTESNMIPYILQYKASEDAAQYTMSCFMSFADAVAEINKLGVKRDYTIAINTYGDAVNHVGTIDTPQVLTMPQAKNIASLTISSADIGNPSGNNSKIYYTGNTITLTCPTTFNNVNFVRVQQVKQGKEKVWVVENDPYNDQNYLNATTIKTAGNMIAFNGKVTFDTPLALDGGKTGRLAIGTGSSVSTIIDMGHNITPQMPSGAYINGSVTNFGEVYLDIHQEIVIRGFKTGSMSKETYNAPKFSATNVDLEGGRIGVGDQKETINGKEVFIANRYPGSITITNLVAKGCSEPNVKTVNVHGKLTITNLILKDSGNIKTWIGADREFSIADKGIIVCGTANATLLTRRNAKGVPYLRIPGSVELEDAKYKIGVSLRPSVEDLETNPEYADANDLTTVKGFPDGASDAQRQLLTATSASADSFTVWKKLIGPDAGPDANVFLMRNEKAKTVQVYKNTEKQ